MPEGGVDSPLEPCWWNIWPEGGGVMWCDGSPGGGVVIMAPAGGVGQCPWTGVSSPLVSCCSLARLHEGLLDVEPAGPWPLRAAEVPGAAGAAAVGVGGVPAAAAALPWLAAGAAQACSCGLGPGPAVGLGAVMELDAACDEGGKL